MLNWDFLSKNQQNNRNRFLELIIQCMSLSFILHHLHKRRSRLSKNMGVLQIWLTTWDFGVVSGLPGAKVRHGTIHSSDPSQM